MRFLIFILRTFKKMATCLVGCVVVLCGVQLVDLRTSFRLPYISSLLLCILILFKTQFVFAEPNIKKVGGKKTQEVSFDAADIDGVVRSPDGAYLLQKQGVKFMPLYKVNKQVERNIKASVEYLR